MAERKKLTPKTLPRSVPEESPDWQRGQEWVQTNMAAQALNAYRQFKIKTAQDAYDYVISQGGTPEQASMARDEVTRGFARSELATTAMTPLGPSRAGPAVREAVSLPAMRTVGSQRAAVTPREYGMTNFELNQPISGALPPPRISPTPGSAADIARNRPPQSLDEMRAALGLPPSETVRAIEATPTTVRPTPGSPAANFRDQPVLTLDQQRAALGLPPAQQEQINEAIRMARQRAAIEAMPVEVSPTVGSAAQRGAEVNRAYAGTLQADRRAALGLPRQTQAELEALDLARMADEGPVPQKVYRMPEDVAQYRRVVNDRYEPPRKQVVRAEVARMDPVEAASQRTLAALEAPAEAAQAARPGAMTVSGGYSPPINYGPFNQTINAPRGGSTLPILAGLGVAGGLGGAGYLATRDRGAPPAAGGAPVAAPPPAGGTSQGDLSQMYEGYQLPAPPETAQAARRFDMGVGSPPIAQTSQNKGREVPQQAEVPLPPIRPERLGRKESVESLWEKYNRSGNPADFVRASKAMQQDMPGFGMEREGQARGGKAQKPDSVHKALEIIHHLISNR
jgi:hypothetical protein